VSEVHETLTKLETGELQLRVRALERERAMILSRVCDDEPPSEEL